MVALLPGQRLIAGTSNFIFGSNLGQPVTPTTVYNTSAIQQKIAAGNFQVMRTSIPANASDAAIASHLNAITLCGCQPLFVLDPTNLAWNEYLITKLGSNCNLYEFGNEPDGSAGGGPYTAAVYAAYWAANIPTLRGINPGAVFIGPAVTHEGIAGGAPGTRGAYISDWLTACVSGGGGALLPDAVSFHDYPCNGVAKQATCDLRLPNRYINDYNTVDGFVKGVLGHSLPLCLTEWNLPDYGLGATYITPRVHQFIDDMVTAGYAMACQFEAGCGEGNPSGSGTLDLVLAFSPFNVNPIYTAIVDKNIQYLQSVPAFLTSQNALNFTGVTSGLNPANQTITLFNETTGASLPYTATSNSAWLSVSPASATIPSAGTRHSTVGVSLAGLAAGTHTGTITYAAGTTTVVVTVTLVVQSTLAFLVSQNALNFTGVTGGSNPANQTLTLTNETSGAALPYTATSNSSWLSVSPASATLPSAGTSLSTIGVSLTGLTTGTHTGTITYAAGATTVVVTVTLNLQSTLAFLTSQNALNFTGVTGGSNPANQSITLTNQSAVTPLPYTAVSNVGWLTVSPTSATLPAAGTSLSTVGVSLTGLTAGTYTGTITYAAGTTTVVVPVTLVLTGSGGSGGGGGGGSLPFLLALADSISQGISDYSATFVSPGALGPRSLSALLSQVSGQGAAQTFGRVQQLPDPRERQFLTQAMSAVVANLTTFSAAVSTTSLAAFWQLYFPLLDTLDSELGGLGLALAAFQPEDGAGVVSAVFAAAFNAYAAQSVALGYRQPGNQPQPLDGSLFFPVSTIDPLYTFICGTDTLFLAQSAYPGAPSYGGGSAPLYIYKTNAGAAVGGAALTISYLDGNGLPGTTVFITTPAIAGGSSLGHGSVSLGQGAGSVVSVSGTGMTTGESYTIGMPLARLSNGY